jgi:ATP-binding cassette subfamily B (MDR/TAP) protein 1
MSTRPSSTDEKDARKQTGILSPNQTASTDFSEKAKEKEDNGSDVPPVSIFQLFRFSTGFELFLDIIGLVAAAAAGAAQVCSMIVRVFLKLIFFNFSE